MSKKPKWMWGVSEVNQCDYCKKTFTDNEAKTEQGRLESGVTHTDEPLRIICPHCGVAQGEGIK